MKPLIRVKPNKKDTAIQPAPLHHWSRRDFLKRGMLATSLSTMAPSAVMAMLAKNAYGGGTTSCTPNMVGPSGCIAQLYRNGGPAVGAMFLCAQQVSILNSNASLTLPGGTITTVGANVASDYGISGGSNVQLVGSNWWLDITSPFAVGILTCPTGFPGGQTAWNNALSRTTLGGNFGQFNADDNIGNALGQIGGCGSMKQSMTGTDISINQMSPRVNWARALPNFQPSLTSAPQPTGTLPSLTPAALQVGFSMTPSANVNQTFMTNMAQTADTLSQVFASVFSSGRTAAAQSVTTAVCGFYNDQTIAQANFAGTLFDPTNANIPPAIQNVSTAVAANPEMQAFLLAYYQSAVGYVGSVSAVQDDCDYHPGQLPMTAAVKDFEAGQIFAMWLAASVIAGKRGAFICNQNGRVNCQGVTSSTITVPAYVTGTTATTMSVSGPVSVADAGGSLNAGFIVLYDPSSAPGSTTCTSPLGVNSCSPSTSGLLMTTGNFNTTTGAVTGCGAATSVPTAMAGLYLTALEFIGGGNSLLGPAEAIMLAAQIANPAGLILIS